MKTKSRREFQHLPGFQNHKFVHNNLHTEKQITYLYTEELLRSLLPACSRFITYHSIRHVRDERHTYRRTVRKANGPK